MSRRVLVIIPEQKYTLYIEDEDWDEWSEDTSSLDPLYDSYVSHMIEDFEFTVKIFDGDDKVAQYGG